MVKKSDRSKFTITEFLTIIAIIGMFVGSSIVYKSHMDDVRIDQIRLNKISAIASALEKYFASNGFYPSCNLMSGTAPEVVKTLGNVSISALSSPTDKVGDNSILPKCANLDANDSNDKFSYLGDGGCVLNPTQNCISFTLKYRGQSTGKIKTFDSKNH